MKVLNIFSLAKGGLKKKVTEKQLSSNKKLQDGSTPAPTKSCISNDLRGLINDKWCNDNCNHDPPNCPPNKCNCQQQTFIYTPRTGDTCSSLRKIIMNKQYDDKPIKNLSIKKNGSECDTDETLTPSDILTITGFNIRTITWWENYIVKSGDTCSKIADNFNINLETDIKKYDDSLCKDNSSIFPGDILKIKKTEITLPCINDNLDPGDIALCNESDLCTSTIKGGCSKKLQCSDIKDEFTCNRKIKCAYNTRQKTCDIFENKYDKCANNNCEDYGSQCSCPGNNKPGKINCEYYGQYGCTYYYTKDCIWDTNKCTSKQ